MQANQITLNVDVANNGTPVEQIYNRYEETQNRSTYISTSHLPDDRDMFSLYRTFPTKSGNFKGVAKSAIKLTDDVAVAGVDSSTTLTAPTILEISFSVPVGAPVADLKEIRQRAIALLDNDSFMDSLNVQLMV